MKRLKILGGIVLAFAGAICNQIAHQVGYYNTILNWMCIGIIIVGIALVVKIAKQKKKGTYLKKDISTNNHSTTSVEHGR